MTVVLSVVITQRSVPLTSAACRPAFSVPCCAAVQAVPRFRTSGDPGPPGGEVLREAGLGHVCQKRQHQGDLLEPKQYQGEEALAAHCDLYSPACSVMMGAGVRCWGAIFGCCGPDRCGFKLHGGSWREVGLQWGFAWCRRRDPFVSCFSCVTVSWEPPWTGSWDCGWGRSTAWPCIGLSPVTTSVWRLASSRTSTANGCCGQRRMMRWRIRR